VAAEALGRLSPKIIDMAGRSDSMSDAELGQRVDALPRDEFYEWIVLGAEGIAAIIRESRRIAT
jgi:hypothetical protein